MKHGLFSKSWTEGTVAFFYRGIDQGCHRHCNRANETLEDITDRELAELKLRKAKSGFAQLVENAGEIIVVAQNNILKYVNPMTTKVTVFLRKNYTRAPFWNLSIRRQELVAERYQKRISGADPPSVTIQACEQRREHQVGRINGVRITWINLPQH